MFQGRRWTFARFVGEFDSLQLHEYLLKIYIMNYVIMDCVILVILLIFSIIGICCIAYIIYTAIEVERYLKKLEEAENK